MPDIIRLDNTITALNRSMLVNRSTGMGTMRDSFNETEVGYVPILGEQELRSLHRGNWWIRRIIDVPAMDMVKAGVTLTHPSNDAEAIQKVLGLYEAGGEQSPYSRKMGGAMAFQRAEMYARWFGRGYIVMRVNGNEKLEKPLTKVKSFEGFSVLDRYQLRPSNDAINYEDPEFYQIARRYQRGSELKGAEFHQKIHETRVLVFDGAFIHPYDINLESADGAHDSVVQSLYECFCRHYAVQNSIAKGLDSYSLFKVAIANLGELMMQDEGEAALTKTLNAIAEMISMHRILVQDGETSNSEFQERSFTGVAENAKGFKDELTAASGLPHYKLWGSVDKSGLADSGGAESRAWADTVNSLQISQFKDNHRRVFNALFEATGGVIPDGYGIDYPSIYKATPKEEAELKKTEADTYSTLITAEVLNPLEVKLALATGEEIGNVLDAEAIEVELEKTKSFESIGKGENGRADFKYSHINFKPPLSVQKAFQRALSATESGKLKIGSGMESATKAWAKKLASGQPVSPEKARQGYRWFKRNARFESSPKDSPAWASWAYWGYSEGRSWFNRLWQQMESAGRANESRNDDATPTKRILKWNDFEIGLQYLPFEKRHGRVLPAGYGHFRKTRGADGMAVDVYVGTQLTSSKVFVVDQLIDGEFDEEKMVIGVERMEDAISIYTSAMPREMMGGVREISLEDLAKYRTNVEVKADAEQFVPASSGSVTTTLPALAESDFDWASVRDIADEQGWEW
ncbi:MAG: phage portal protein, partial [Cyanobacteria bacterium J06642_11]